MGMRAWGVAGLLVALAGPAFASDEVFFRFQVRDLAVLRLLPEEISIDRVDEASHTVYAYAREGVFRALRAGGGRWNPLAGSLRPQSLSRLPHAADVAEGLTMLDGPASDPLAGYFAYPDYVKFMEEMAAAHPEICQLVEYGKSVQGRRLLAMKISDNAREDEDEPEILMDSTMHGNETTGYSMLLQLIRELVENGGDERVARIVNGSEIWVLPLRNPDGTYAGGDATVSGARRYNARSVDLNRDFPPYGKDESAHTRSVEPENTAFIRFAKERSFVLGSNLHGGAEVVNYPWDAIVGRHPDDDWFRATARAYADKVHERDPKYMTEMENGITNGYDWYQVTGSEQDYMNYHRHTRLVTLEVSLAKLVPATQLRKYWELNREALFDSLDLGGKGIFGKVVDADGVPVRARVSVAGRDRDGSWVESAAGLGDFHRPLLAGEYVIDVSAPGFGTRRIEGVAVPAGGGVDLGEVVLSRE